MKVIRHQRKAEQPGRGPGQGLPQQGKKGCVVAFLVEYLAACITPVESVVTEPGWSRASGTWHADLMQGLLEGRKKVSGSGGGI